MKRVADIQVWESYTRTGDAKFLAKLRSGAHFVSAGGWTEREAVDKCWQELDRKKADEIGTCRTMVGPDQVCGKPAIGTHKVQMVSDHKDHELGYCAVHGPK
jgi:hypothetical protein